MESSDRDVIGERLDWREDVSIELKLFAMNLLLPNSERRNLTVAEAVLYVLLDGAEHSERELWDCAGSRYVAGLRVLDQYGLIIKASEKDGEKTFSVDFAGSSRGNDAGTAVKHSLAMRFLELSELEHGDPDIEQLL